jgi:hypothetical protein
MRKCALAASLVVVVASWGCTDLIGKPDAGPATPEAFCAALPTGGVGTMFYCSSTRTNLQGNLPNGWLGQCFIPDRSFSGLVGYSGYTSNGGRLPVVPTQSEAFADCGATVTSSGFCSGVTQCTRQ